MNKRDTDLLDMLPALEDGSLMYTPISICRDMVNLIPDDVFNKDAKFLDIACKSGRFLREIMYRLMESKQMVSEPQNFNRPKRIIQKLKMCGAERHFFYA